jgi:hypothetical protein
MFKTLLFAVVAGASAPIYADLRFARPEHVVPDTVFNTSMPRWQRSMLHDEHADFNTEVHTLPVTDVSDSGSSASPSLLADGFEYVDLSDTVKSILPGISLSGSRVGPQLNQHADDDADTEENDIAKALQERHAFRLRHAFHWCVYCGGFVVRKGGPLGVPLHPPQYNASKEGRISISPNMVAMRVHIDQDLQGEPLLRMGIHWLFRAPFVQLLNVWLPINEPRVRPLALMNTSTLRREQLLRCDDSETDCC